MSLRNKLIQNFTLAILLSILVFSVSISVFINKTMTSYLINDRNAEFEKIKTEFEEIFWNRGEQEVRARLEQYSKEENVYIEIFNMKNESIAKFEGIDDNLKNQGKFVTKSYSFYSPQTNEYFGYLLIGYMEDSYQTSKQANELRENTVDSILITLLISCFMGFLISVVFSRTISKPILEISKAAESIKDGDYSIDLKDSEINELNELTNNIRFLSKNLEMQEKLRIQYAQDISHELRTPLTNLGLHLEAMKDGIIDADDDTINILLGEVRRLNGLVDNLKKTFDDNSEFVKFHKEKFNLSKLLNTINESLSPRLINNNIKLTTDIKDDVIINSDSDKITQIMYNLITNAIKAIGKDGNINITLKEDKKNIYIDVKDDGVGIEKEKIPYIFDRFYRIDDARNTKTNGHGLGLSITKTFTEALDGRIKVKSKLGSGSTFSLIFQK
ncbi:MAG: HAMP domain-containing sensor histidine kinase [Tissierellia bacterium]|nr:HAMP domain-containing sensor histidine kinase [Tissierellia bacterium]